MAVSHVFSNAVGDWTGTVTLFNSQASTTTAAATNIVRPSNWNSVHNEFSTLGGNTLLSSTASGTNIQLYASGPSVSLVGSSDTIVISSPPHISFLECPGPLLGNVGMGLASNSGSVSLVGLFNVAEPISASFIRLPMSMVTNSTTLATTAASMSASAEVYSTWNAVVYSLGTGASSRSLMSVASGSAGATFRNSISVAANGTQYSVTQAVTMPVEGGTTSTSTQYSISNTNYSFTTQQIVTNFSGNRFWDIPFANSLSAGPFWIVLGLTSSSATNSTGISAATNCNVRYSALVGMTVGGIFFGVMGSTNLSSGLQLGGGSFSTAGGGTTANFPVSAISSSAGQARLYFQLVRSA